MNLHSLQKTYKTKRSKRVGRGGNKGSYAGRGMKGQKSRSGSKAKPRVGFAGGDTLPYKKIPKKRGFKFKPIVVKPKVSINIKKLDKIFKDNDKVNPEILLEKGLIRKVHGMLPEVKLLGGGALSKKLLVENCQMSESVKKFLSNSGVDSSIKDKSDGEKEIKSKIKNQKANTHIKNQK